MKSWSAFQTGAQVMCKGSERSERCEARAREDLTRERAYGVEGQ